MLIRTIYIFLLNLITYGGGGVYIPVYEHYYTEIFKIMSTEQYYSVISILNIIPGVTGGKLAGYAMYYEYGYLGMIVAIITFAASGIILVLLLDKLLMQVKENSLFIEINKNIKPVVGGILLSITYQFLQMAENQMSDLLFWLITLVVCYLLIIKKVKIFKVVSIFFVLFSFIYGFVL